MSEVAPNIEHPDVDISSPIDDKSTQKPIWERKGMTEEQYRKEKSEQILRISDKLIKRADDIDSINATRGYRFQRRRSRSKNPLYNPHSKSKVIHRKSYTTADPYKRVNEGETSYSIDTYRKSGASGKPKKEIFAVKLSEDHGVAGRIVPDSTRIEINPKGKDTGRGFPSIPGIKSESSGHDSVHGLNTEEMVRASARILRNIKSDIQKKSS